MSKERTDLDKGLYVLCIFTDTLNNKKGRVSITYFTVQCLFVKQKLYLLKRKCVESGGHRDRSAGH